MEENKEMIRLPIDDGVDSGELFGILDANIKQVEHATGTGILLRDGVLLLRGAEPSLAAEIVQKMMDTIKVGSKLDRQKVSYLIDMVAEGHRVDERMTAGDILCYTHKGRPLKPKTMAQKQYVDKIRQNDMVFGIGPAGTGKTYLACAMAVNAYKNKEIEKIILARPAVEAGESLGFLPGDLQEKVDPYLRPLYDALFEIMGQEAASRLKEKEVIEVVPLAYMRGRTLDNAFIILDEAQNTTKEQMKMFLTRMGFHSKVVVTGDITQIDLPRGTGSGLVEARRILDGVEGIAFSYLTDVDVVRHELVKRIIKAYHEAEACNKQEKRSGSKR